MEQFEVNIKRDLTIWEQYNSIRMHSVAICGPLEREDYVVQPIVDVSPPKWHLGHTTWFFENFVLVPFAFKYRAFNSDYNFVFNSYYESLGARVIRTDRGNLSRPTVDEVYQYRSYVDEAMHTFLQQELSDEIREILIMGLNHEQQHQELLWYDIKYILGHNPLFPAYQEDNVESAYSRQARGWIDVEEGLYEVGYEGEGFHFDNELNRHKVYLQPFSIAAGLVSNKEYLEFIDAGGYTDFNYWHAEGWDWVKEKQVKSPCYWHQIDNKWYRYSLSGLSPLNLEDPVSHISFFEAWAYAEWKGCRLPTEFEWEVASSLFSWGTLWEWTQSAYLPYPGYSRAEGAIGEYNGKFMVNQNVLRGASVATPKGHSRFSYRNFFHPDLNWMFSGIRLAR